MIAICFFARLILFVMMMMMIWKLEVWSKCPSEGYKNDYFLSSLRPECRRREARREKVPVKTEAS